jgi:hypothetical protein
VATGFTEGHGADCRDLNTSGVMVWDAELAGWVFYSEPCNWTLNCTKEHVQIGPEEWMDIPKWTLHAVSVPCECTWTSYDWVPSGLTLPHCDFDCDGGAFYVDCCSGGRDCEGTVQIWPI